jgi:hypothetical protein
MRAAIVNSNPQPIPFFGMRKVFHASELRHLLSIMVAPTAAYQPPTKSPARFPARALDLTFYFSIHDLILFVKDFRSRWLPCAGSVG